jgi:exodeoxyribonuclease VII small subunit
LYLRGGGSVLVGCQQQIFTIAMVKTKVSHIGLTTIPGFAVPMTKASTTPKSADKAAQALSYEQALEQLERLVAAMEAGQLPLDQLLESYKSGAELLRFCRTRLQAVEQQVKVLEAGEMKPWEGD